MGGRGQRISDSRWWREGNIVSLLTRPTHQGISFLFFDFSVKQLMFTTKIPRNKKRDDDGKQMDVILKLRNRHSHSKISQVMGPGR